MDKKKQSPDFKNNKTTPIRKLIAVVDNILVKIEEGILSLGIIALSVLVIGSVLSRYLFNHSWTFMEEVSNAIMISITFLGLGYWVRKARHIRMSAIHDILPRSIRKILIIFVYFITSMVMLLMGYWSLLYIAQVIKGGNVTPALSIPYYFIIMCAPVGFFMAVIEYFLAIYKNLNSKEVYLSIDVPDLYEDDIQAVSSLDLEVKKGTP